MASTADSIECLPASATTCRPSVVYVSDRFPHCRCVTPPLPLHLFSVSLPVGDASLNSSVASRRNLTAPLDTLGGRGGERGGTEFPGA
jgi:hypothetical protein